jgi:hypothetical protein
LFGSGFAPPYHFETLERQIFINLVDQSQRGCDLPCLPASGDDRGLITQLLDDKL